MGATRVGFLRRRRTGRREGWESEGWGAVGGTRLGRHSSPRRGPGVCPPRVVEGHSLGTFDGPLKAVATLFRDRMGPPTLPTRNLLTVTRL